MSQTGAILIIEDSDDDYEAAAVALTQDSNLANPVFRAETGDKALDMLFGRGPDALTEDTIPSLILLDLNMPGTDGRDVLREIKSSDNLKSIPVIVMTTSQDERDINACYQAGANSYILKPVDIEGFLAAVARLRDYWLKVVLLPVAQD